MQTKQNAEQIVVRYPSSHDRIIRKSQDSKGRHKSKSQLVKLLSRIKQESRKCEIIIQDTPERRATESNQTNNSKCEDPYIGQETTLDLQVGKPKHRKRIKPKPKPINYQLFPPIRQIEQMVNRTNRLNQVEQHIILNYLNAQVKIQTANIATKTRRKHSQTNLDKKVKQTPSHNTAKTHEFSVNHNNTAHPTPLPSPTVSDQIIIEQHSQKSKSHGNKSEYDTVDTGIKHHSLSINGELLEHSFKSNNFKKKQWVPVSPFQLKTQFIKLKRLAAATKPTTKDSVVSSRLELPFLPTQQQVGSFIKNYIPKNKEISIVDLFKSQHFQIEYNENQLFFGQVRNGNRHGLGVHLKKNFIFEGKWAEGNMLQGYEYNDIGVYRGEYVNNLKQGKGEFQWLNGELYSGEWLLGKKHGRGLWKAPNGDGYFGQWKYGCVQGQGVHTTFNKQKYQGQFKNFLKDGWGKQTFANGDFYNGNYANGNPHGKGTYKWIDGTTYEGEFSFGYRQGKGCLTTPSGLVYLGQFKLEYPEGLCELTFQNGDIYIGQFYHGRKHGKGVLKMVSKKMIYDGFWKNDEFIEKVVKK